MTAFGKLSDRSHKLLVDFFADEFSLTVEEAIQDLWDMPRSWIRAHMQAARYGYI